MKRYGRVGLGIVAAGALLIGVALPKTSVAAGGLELSIVVGRDASYVDPDGRKILITSQPTEFSVQVRNAADVSKQVWTDRMSGTLSKLRFEVTDEQGNRTVISKKEVFGQGEVWASRYLDPGESVVSSILLTPEEWNNVSRVPAGEVRRITVRAIYESGSETLTSETYEVTIAPYAAPDIMTPPPPVAPPDAAPPITVIH
ncbi:MAG: hypothetical protein K8T26_05305 [Lentisphaerae bacterium]|nr:hypothetical protein [Lentisphaerota bacterium]